jgi:D-threonate/D-erythronate kinase
MPRILLLMPTNTLLSQSEPKADRMDLERIIVVADDLTGACDSGVAFLASGRRVRVVLNSDGSASIDPQCAYPEAVLAFTTETRHRTPKESTERVATVLMPFTSERVGHLYFKKIDSAARGNFGPEIMAALESSHARLALVAPAFPHAGRTVDGGMLDIRDSAGQHTTISLRSLFSEVDGAHVDVLAVGSEAVLEQKLAHALSRGIRIVLCDAKSQADLERLANAALRLPQPILWAGSAGLARALAAVLPALEQRDTIPLARSIGRTMLFVGTDHPVTTLQVSHFEAQPTDPAQCSIHRVDSQSQKKIRDAFEVAPVGALILTGGDTAAFVLRALNASSIILGGEISPGIPWGILHGGLADGCTVITKSGGFGEKDALARAYEFCNRRAL